MLHVEEIKKELEALNQELGQYEAAGDTDRLRELLAENSAANTPLLAFRRASGACVDGATFLADAPAKAGPRETRDLEIELVGRCRAIVKCIVHSGGADYSNLRIFTRADEGAKWRLLAWANEKVV